MRLMIIFSFELHKIGSWLSGKAQDKFHKFLLLNLHVKFCG